MSRSILAVTILTIVLTAAFAVAQQAGQRSSQQQWQSGAGGSTAGQAGMTMRDRMITGAEQVSTIANQQNIDLAKVIQTAEQQAKGKAVAAVLLQPRGQMGTGGSAGATGGSTAQGGAGGSSAQQTLNAHVAVATQSQLQFVALDAKSDKVLTMQSHPFIQDLWAPQGGTGGSSGTSGMSGSTSGGTSAQQQSGTYGGQGGSTGMQGQAGAAGSSMGRGALTQQHAQQIYTQVEQNNADLRKAVQAAESDTKGKAVAAFFTLRGQGMGGSAMGQSGGTGSSPGQSSSATGGQGGSAGQQNLTAHVFTVANNQIKLAIVNAKTNKVENVETRQVISTPWEGNMGAGGSTGSSGMSSGQSGVQQESTTSGTGSGASGEEFPTGSGQGTGPGSLGGQ